MDLTELNSLKWRKKVFEFHFGCWSLGFTNRCKRNEEVKVCSAHSDDAKKKNFYIEETNQEQVW